MPPDTPVGDDFTSILEACRQFLLAIAHAELPGELRAKGGASDLVSTPGAYDAALEMVEVSRRQELEARAHEEARLTDARERGLPMERRTG